MVISTFKDLTSNLATISVAEERLISLVPERDNISSVIKDAFEL